MSDRFLLVWLVFSFLWDFAVFGCTAWVVFWRGHSGWWFLFAVVLTWSDTLFTVIKKRYGIEESE